MPMFVASGECGAGPSSSSEKTNTCNGRSPKQLSEAMAERPTLMSAWLNGGPIVVTVTDEETVGAWLS